MNTIAHEIANTTVQPQFVQNHIDFEARRLLGLGGSDIAAVLGINPFKTAYELYLEKVEGHKVDLSNNEKVLWGILLEDPIAKRYEQLTGSMLFCTGMVKHKKYPFLIAHLSGPHSQDNFSLNLR